MTTDDDPYTVYNRETGELVQLRAEPSTEESSPNLLVQLAEQCVVDSQRWFPEVAPKSTDTSRDTVAQIIHHTVAMFGEVGEFANIVKKIERRSLDLYDEEVQRQLQDELTDVLIYVLNLAGMLGIDLLQAYENKREYNEARFGNGNRST